MPHTSGSLARFLLSRRIISQLQLDEASKLARMGDISIEDALVQLGHVKLHDMICAFLEALNLPFTGLGKVTIPQPVLDLVPECLAREHTVLPLATFDGRLFLATSDPFDRETLQTLQYILNRDIWPVPAQRGQILEAIERHYPESTQESFDSMLAEFTDCAIDFSEEARDIFETDFDLPALEDTGSEAVALDESLSDLQSSDFDLTVSDADLERHAAALDENEREVVVLEEEEEGSCFELLLEDEPAESRPMPARAGGRGNVTRQATVRYYHRMNPGRLFPLLVVISRRAIEKAIKKHVSQQAKEFRVNLDSIVEIEPVLPGCNCYPPREQVTISRGESSAKFYVVPHVTGQLVHARVVVRQNGKILTEVPLEVRVVKQGLTVLMGGLNLVLPFGLMVLKHFHLDFESQLASGFDLYAAVIQLALHSFSPASLAGLMLVLTGASFLWFRPRQRNVFWDIRLIGPEPASEKSDQPPAAADLCRENQPDNQAALFATAEGWFLRGDFGKALRYYESGLSLGRAPALIYHHASLAAGQLGNNARALAILKEAASRLPAAQMKGALWFNMGCFAARLGWPADAIRYLHRAVKAGYTNADKFRSDPDLQSLHGRTDFKRLLRSLEEPAPAKR